MSLESVFLKHKKIALAKLQSAKEENLVDRGVLNILSLINQLDDYYTSSSCAGRVLLLELPSLGDKKNAVFLGKWHRKIESVEVLNSLEKASKGFLCGNE